MKYDLINENPNSDRELGFKLSRTQNYFDRSYVIRILITCFFGCCLFLFFHFRQTYVEVLELGSKAGRYIVSQIDFVFPDEEATIILKQQAASEIGPIYKIPEEDITDKLNDFQKKFISEPKEEQIIKENKLEKIIESLYFLSDQLQNIRFTDSRTLSTLEELPLKEIKIPSFNYYVFVPKRGNLSTLPKSFWNETQQHFSEKGFSNEVSDFVLKYFAGERWNFEVDQETISSLKRYIQAQIPEKMTHVRPGERIIDQGEMVTPKHLAMIKAMKEALKLQRDYLDPITIIGSVLMTLLFLCVALCYLIYYQKDTFYSNRKLALLGTILLLDFAFAKIGEFALIKNATSLIDIIHFPLFVPFAALLLASLMGSRIAAFFAVFLSIVFSMALAIDSLPFLIINLFTAMLVIFCTRSIRRRKEIFIICGKGWLGSLCVIIAFHFYGGSPSNIFLVTNFSSTFIFMALTAILVVGLLPVLESIFQIMTDITMMEYMDPSHELLRRLTIEAPGTYQHSLIVGNLAEAAASAVKANPLFCRVATLYHDIGKLKHPQYFTENQLGGVDMHQLLTPLESAQVIIAHVAEGVTLARKYSLPEQFIDIIKEHHGTTLVYYFYHKQLEFLKGDKNQIDESNFRYGGPKPRSKESTIIMIADTLEAASRCLDVYTEESITNLVESLIAQKAEDGQFDESLLTFEEVKIIKKTMIQGLLAATHPRVKYPAHHPGEEG
jgi:cyclic-di-AMP phosphodiesterase PgpH